MTASFEYDDLASADFLLQVSELQATVTGRRFAHIKMTVAITTTAIDMGTVTIPGWAIFINRDTSNFISLQVATGSTKFAKLIPAPVSNPLWGGFWMGMMDPAMTAPFAIADTATCALEYFIAQA